VSASPQPPPQASAPQAQPPQAQPPRAKDTNWSRRFIVFGVVIAGVLVLGYVGAAFLPRWWAHRVGDQANESMAGAIMLGVFYGFLFTVLPLLLIVWGIRKRRSGKAWLFIVGGVLLLALPNLLTLGIVVGRGDAAHAGDRTLDVEAPGFRGATVAGVLLAVGFVAYVWHLSASRRRARARAELPKSDEPVSS
jgi:hypothetical protein